MAGTGREGGSAVVCVAMGSILRTTKEDKRWGEIGESIQKPV